ncbi:MAG: type II toxin-antitoxin system ParD family antitoxin [Candidatus Entotheonellia bacterium]
MTISLPEPLKAFVEAQVAEGSYHSAGEYIGELIRADQKRKAEERLEALLLAGLNSGEPIEVTEAFWNEKRRQLLERHRMGHGS